MGTAREYPELRAVHYFRRTITFAADGENFRLCGTVPTGAIITQVWLKRDTAYDDSGTDTISVGYTGAGYTDFHNAVDVSSGGATCTLSAATTVYEAVAETGVYAGYAGQNNNATAGQATIIGHFVLDNDL